MLGGDGGEAGDEIAQCGVGDKSPPAELHRFELAGADQFKDGGATNVQQRAAFSTLCAMRAAPGGRDRAAESDWLRWLRFGMSFIRFY